MSQGGNDQNLSRTRFYKVRHYRKVLSGSAIVLFPNDKDYLIQKRGLFYVSSLHHDSWVIGNEKYIFLYSLGADLYAN
tara:strand:- start:644 stop:877 length:234 start_codon:yes stop_codon:yes gene_type:complete